MASPLSISAPRSCGSPHTNFLPRKTFPHSTQTQIRPSLHSPLSPLLPHSHSSTGPLTIAAAVFPSDVALASFLSPADNRRKAIDATRKGMDLFRKGDVEGSITQFDQAMDLDPSQKPYLWQRGLSLYYAGRFQEAAEQFRADVAVNPNDTEESIWCFLSEAMMLGAEEARRKFLEVGRDSRPIMRAAYELFRTGQPGPQELIEMVKRSPNTGSEFYGLLYIGLFYESERDAGKAEEYITRATETQYAWTSGDYMAALSRVHCQVRGWRRESI